jgi:hypothetical protein
MCADAAASHAWLIEVGAVVAVPAARLVNHPSMPLGDAKKSLAAVAAGLEELVAAPAARG